ncbi:MAG: hypothetical protein PHQ90_13705 [Sulfuricurvum sp.]|uniref:hypothetical protein n=1 Tax=Sulfuricurvum sp. TaxID=2025608 RepID=UPI00261C5766|nr:hypothetical protein [Sulfuricurvum sp.]MDD2370351.1 hypothetical protein [Sulfuricurvum sp.]MDD2950416.1 hypothetical protein [Sulfuricurvum sp.]MDD5118657.1 hypothetical protein [Sulfuricurvum sp.]
MQFDGDALTIGLDMSMEEVREFEQFVRPRIEYIETIEVEEGGTLKSSALLALLTSLKRTRPELRIPFLERGTTTSNVYGTLHWICYD